MRKGIEGLAGLAQDMLRQKPTGGAVFAFRGRRGQRATFYIRFSIFEDRLSLASPVWTDATGLAIPAWQGLEVHLHGRAA
jgi:transposase